MGTITRALLLIAMALLGGCAAYRPAPLDRSPHLAPRLASLDGGGGVLTARRLDRLVLAHNPDLVAARAKLGLAEAQILQANLLPNPQVVLSYPFYISGPDGSDGFGLSVAQDVRSLLLRPTKREAATSGAGEIRAALLWQEWQTMGKARLLFVDLVAGERSAASLKRSGKLLRDRLTASNALIQSGNGPLSNLSPDLGAVADAQKVEDDLARNQLSRRHQLCALLGLAPDAPLPLAGDIELPRLDERRVMRDQASLADRRPDLVALQYGYRSEDARLRQAIIAQFPNVVVGVLGGRDTNMVYSAGPQVSFDLPIFDRNEAAIAAETATRAELGRTFEARLTAATGEIGALLADQRLLRRQLDALGPQVEAARAIASKTEAAHRDGNVDERTFIDVQVAVTAQELRRIALRQALLEGQVSLAMLTGAGLPAPRLDTVPIPDNPLGLLHTAER